MIKEKYDITQGEKIKMKKRKEQLVQKQTVDKDGEYSELLHSADVRGCRVEVLASEEEMAKTLQTRFENAGAQEVETSYLEPTAPVCAKATKMPSRRVVAPEKTLEKHSLTEIPSIEDMSREYVYQGKETERTELFEDAEDAETLHEKGVKQDFAYFKKKVNQRVLLLATLVGVCCALVATGVLLIALKLSALILRPDLYFIFGGLVAVVSGLIFYLFARQGDKKLAVKMDKVYHLGESVQTMVENAKKESGIIQLQRESTNAKISKIKRKKATAGRIVALALMPILAFSVLFTGLVVPQKVVAAPIPEENLPSDIQESQIQDLKILINQVKILYEVENVADEESIPALPKAHLDTLGELLETVVYYQEQQQSNGVGWTNQQRREAVTDAMKSVMQATKPYVSYREISVGLRKNEMVAFLGESLYKGGKAYAVGNTYNYNFVYNQKLRDEKEEKDSVLKKAIQTQLQECCNKIFSSFEEIAYAQYGVTMYNYQNAIVGALTEVTVPEEDGLLAAVNALAANFGLVAANFDRLDAASVDTYLKNNVVGAFQQSALEILYEQAYDSLMQEFICTSLHTIFDVEIPKDEGNLGQGGEDDTGDEGGKENQDDFEHSKFPDWPSSDLVIDVNGEKVHYGEILNEGNYGKILEFSKTEGLPQEIKDYIEKYLNEIKSNQKDSD